MTSHNGGFRLWELKYCEAPGCHPCNGTPSASSQRLVAFVRSCVWIDVRPSPKVCLFLRFATFFMDKSVYITKLQGDDTSLQVKTTKQGTNPAGHAPSLRPRRNRTAAPTAKMKPSSFRQFSRSKTSPPTPPKWRASQSAASLPTSAAAARRVCLGG